MSVEKGSSSTKDATAYSLNISWSSVLPPEHARVCVGPGWGGGKGNWAQCYSLRGENQF